MTIHDLVEQVRESQLLASRFITQLPRFEIDGVLADARKAQEAMAQLQGSIDSSMFAAARAAQKMAEDNQRLIDACKSIALPPSIDFSVLNRPVPEIQVHEPAYMPYINELDTDANAEEDEDVRTIVRPELERTIGFAKKGFRPKD